MQPTEPISTDLFLLNSDNTYTQSDVLGRVISYLISSNIWMWSPKNIRALNLVSKAWNHLIGETKPTIVKNMLEHWRVSKNKHDTFYALHPLYKPTYAPSQDELDLVLCSLQGASFDSFNQIELTELINRCFTKLMNINVDAASKLIDKSDSIQKREFELAKNYGQKLLAQRIANKLTFEDARSIVSDSCFEMEDYQFPAIKNTTDAERLSIFDYLLDSESENNLIILLKKGYPLPKDKPLDSDNLSYYLIEGMSLPLSRGTSKPYFYKLIKNTYYQSALVVLEQGFELSKYPFESVKALNCIINIRDPFNTESFKSSCDELILKFIEQKVPLISLKSYNLILKALNKQFPESVILAMIEKGPQLNAEQFHQCISTAYEYNRQNIALALFKRGFDPSFTDSLKKKTKISPFTIALKENISEEMMITLLNEEYPLPEEQKEIIDEKEYPIPFFYEVLTHYKFTFALELLKKGLVDPKRWKFSADSAGPVEFLFQIRPHILDEDFRKKYDHLLVELIKEGASLVTKRQEEKSLLFRAIDVSSATDRACPLKKIAIAMIAKSADPEFKLMSLNLLKAIQEKKSDIALALLRAKYSVPIKDYLNLVYQLLAEAIAYQLNEVIPTLNRRISYFEDKAKKTP